MEDPEDLPELPLDDPELLELDVIGFLGLASASASAVTSASASASASISALVSVVVSATTWVSTEVSASSISSTTDWSSVRETAFVRKVGAAARAATVKN